jgi:hypothetical protein
MKPLLPAPTTRESERCQTRCPRQNLCVCRADVRHTLHICSSPDCACHSRERYEGRPLRGIYG